MAKQIRDEHWLKQQLVKALHWDEDVTEGVLGLIINASSPEEVQEVTTAYMNNDPAAVAAISDFMAARKGGAQPSQQAQQSKQQPQQQDSRSGPGSSSSPSVSAAQRAPPKQAQAAPKQQQQQPPQQQDRWLHLGGQAPSADSGGTSQAAEANQQLSSKQQAEATLSMFKRGGRISTRPARDGAAAGGGAGSKGRKGEQLDSITAKLERKVANCLSCGKIFDCRNVTNDVIRFIDSGFKCTYCGAAVAMTQQQRIQQAQAAVQHHDEQEPTAAGGSTSSPADTAAAAQAQAIAFKDRLVDYDRHSQKRTTVIDDQSDFFEIETNAWLTEEERAELRRRAELEEEAAAARRTKVTVTLDLLGRKVVVADSADAAGPAGPGGSSGSSFELGGGSSATQQLLQQVQAVAARQGRSNGGADGAQQGAAAGGSGKQAPAETLAEALAAISNLRITAHPNLTTTPVFIPKQKQQQPQVPEQQATHQQQQQQHKQHKQKPKQTPKQQRTGGKASAGQVPAKQQRQRLSAAASRAAAVDSRVQDDSIFCDFETELLCDELLKKQEPRITQVAAL